MSGLSAMKQTGLRWAWVALLILILDLVIKQIIVNTIEVGGFNRVEVLPFFNLLQVHNHGAAFSFLDDQGGWQRWLFTILAIAISGLLLRWMQQTPAHRWWLNVGYAAIIGGAIGNLVDRLTRGYVIDYLHFYWQDYHFAVFNFADMAICAGTAMIIIDSFIQKPQATKTDKDA